MPARPHSTAPSARDTSPTYQLANRLLGGRRVLHRLIHDEAEAHQRILQGLPTRALLRLLADLHVVPTASLLQVIGMSQRNYQRRKEAAERDPAAKLTVDEGSRLWRFTELLVQATQTLGSREAAEKWFATPQPGLDGRRPIELMATAPGAELVEDLLIRMEYDVYT